MTRLLESAPYGPRDDERFLEEMNALCAHHLRGCPNYKRVWPDFTGAASVEELPYLHVGAFKWVDFKTLAESIRHERTLNSSATTSGVASRIALDAHSSDLQGQSTQAILGDFLGQSHRPLLVIDSARSLRMRGEISARVAAAMSLRPMATDLHFLLAAPEDASSMKWDLLASILCENDEFLVYGFTWILYMAWVKGEMPDEVKRALRDKSIYFVHSGGWKKLEASKVSRESFDAALLEGLAPESRVVDFYGLVEQVGVVYPLCEFGYRHIPIWADALVRDPISLEPLEGEPGVLQLLNLLAYGAPYHSVLTEDMGRITPGTCGCGRSGRKFELLGRIPKAEIRGCANV